MRREEAARPGRLPPRTRCLTAVPAILGRLIWDPSRDSDSVWDPSGIPKQGLRLSVGSIRDPQAGTQTQRGGVQYGGEVDVSPDSS